MTTNVLKTAIAMTGIVATPAAMAQAIDISYSGDFPFPGESYVITMAASYGGGDYAMAGIATSLLINEVQGGFSDISLLAPMDGPGTSEGVLGAGSIDGIIAGQLNFPIAGIYADPSNPILFWTATWTYTPDGTGNPVVLDIETQTTRFDVYVDRTSALSESRLDELDEGRLVIVIPAPAGGVALLSGLAMASRRRR